MITKNNIYNLIKDIKTLINSNEFKNKHCEKATFTRNRKLSFRDVVYFILGLPRKSLPTELDLYFDGKNISLSKQAFSKARYQISENAFKDIFNLTTNIDSLANKVNTYDGFRIFAVDGSTVSIPHNPNTEKTFGIYKNNHSEYPMARLTALYDVTNDLIVDAKFTGTDIGEREHAIDLLSSPALLNNSKSKNLVIFDRGYPSRALIHELENKGFYYIIRCYTSFISCVNECPKGDHIVMDYHQNRSTKLRVIKETVEDSPYILISNLFETHQNKEYLYHLYQKRWEVETKYGELKTHIRVENFSGRNPRAIYQELYAALFISNLSALIKSAVESDFESSLITSKHKYQLNRSYIVGVVCRYIKKLLYLFDYKKKLGILMSKIKKLKSIIRPDRHFDRNSSHHKATNGFYIRVNI
jgi:transposase DDE domain